MKSKYVDLQTGEVLSAKQILAWEKGKDRIWRAADELYSLLAKMAEEREHEAQRLVLEASVIRDYLKTYDEAVDGSPEVRARNTPPSETHS
jgi:hypothetical protein